MSRGESYSRERNIFLCQAWMRASENMLKGAQQRTEEFWKIVYEFCSIMATRLLAIWYIYGSASVHDPM